MLRVVGIGMRRPGRLEEGVGVTDDLRICVCVAMEVLRGALRVVGVGVRRPGRLDEGVSVTDDSHICVSVVIEARWCCSEQMACREEGIVVCGRSCILLFCLRA